MRLACLARAVLLGLAGWLAIPVPAAAHPTGITGVKVLLEPKSVLVSVVVHTADLKPGDPEAQIRSRLKLDLDESPFEPATTSLIADRANGLLTWQGSRGTPAQTVVLSTPLFPEHVAGGTLLTVYREGRLEESRLIQPADRGTPPSGGVASVFGRYLHQGVLHIFLGPDHVLFVICLLLLGGGLGRLVKIVTAFTLAHSVTLTLAATGVVNLPSGFVEPVIALSIVIAGAENLRRQEKDSDWRPMLAFGFGLIHGFGFAGALAEVGLPAQALGWALAAFNLGVEAGQMAIVLAVSPVLSLLTARKPAAGMLVARAGSVAVIVAGAFWFVQRLLPT